MRLDTGATFDRYVIEGVLGEGGMGRVYRAFDPRLQRRVALKLLETTAAGEQDAGVVDAILREARAAAALDAPNAVAIFDIGDHQGVPYLAMELVQGRSLRSLVRRCGEVAIERRVGWLVQIARALFAAHRAGIVHRDVKPENIMLREDDVIKVLDFGLAHRAAVAEQASRLTPIPGETWPGKPGKLVGTPPYMAPEHVRGLEIDGRADQFAWGVVAYEVLWGKPPWTKFDTLIAAVDAVLHERPQSLRARGVDVSEEVDAAVLRALEKRREDRFADMGEVLAALGAAELSPSSKLPELRHDDLGPHDATRTLPGNVQTISHNARVEGISRGPTLPAADAPPISGRASPLAQSVRASLAGPVSTRTAGPPSVPEPPPAPEARPSTRRRFAAILGATALAAAAALLTVNRLKPAPAPPVTAAPAPRTTAMMELPPPRECTPAALAEHARGMQNMHDGNWEQARASFERAASVDPHCAGALFRSAMVGFGDRPMAQTREVYQQAVELRGKLDERDQLVLDALELLVRREPSDELAYNARLRQLAERFPGDAELWGLAADHSNDTEFAAMAAQRALEIDPTYSDALQSLGRSLSRSGKFDEALATLDRCVDVAKNSVDCLRERLYLLQKQGRCGEAEQSARMWIARDPSTSAGYRTLAAALASRSGGAGAAEEALRQRWQRLPAGAQDAEALDRALLGALRGDFGETERHARALADRVAESPSYEPHARPAVLLVEALVESGKLTEAAAVASEFHAKSGAWTLSLTAGSLDVDFAQLAPRLLLVARRGGKMSESEWRAARRDWVASVKKPGLIPEETVWALDDALTVETAADAAEVLKRAPAAITVAEQRARSKIVGSHTGAYVGRALLLGGRVDEAIAFLRASSSSCLALSDPFAHTRAKLWLGQALEQKGDTAGACEAYAGVVDRWGQAKPKAVTAEAARKRMEALKCGK